MKCGEDSCGTELDLWDLILLQVDRVRIEFSYIVGQPADVTELLGGGRHLLPAHECDVKCCERGKRMTVKEKQSRERS